MCIQTKPRFLLLLLLKHLYYNFSIFFYQFNFYNVFVFLYTYLMKLSWSKRMVRKFFNIKCKTQQDTAHPTEAFASRGFYLFSLSLCKLKGWCFHFFYSTYFGFGGTEGIKLNLVWFLGFCFILCLNFCIHSFCFWLTLWIWIWCIQTCFSWSGGHGLEYRSRSSLSEREPCTIKKSKTGTSTLFYQLKFIIFFLKMMKLIYTKSL